MATPPPFLINLGFLLLFSTTASTLFFLPSSILTNSTTWRGGPITIFAPSDSSLLLTFGNSSSFSLPLLLPEHSVHGYFPFRRLLTLPFATKIQTLNPHRTLTIISLPTPNRKYSTKVFVTLVEITHPDLFDDGLVLVHGLRGFITFPSPWVIPQPLAFQDSIQRLLFRILSPPPPRDASIVLRLLPEEAMQRLRSSGYGMVADAFGLGVAGNADVGLSVAPTSGFEWTADFEDRHGL